MKENEKVDKKTDEELLAILNNPFTSGISSPIGSEKLRQHLSAKGELDYRSSKSMIILTWCIAGLTFVLTILTGVLVYKEFISK